MIKKNYELGQIVANRSLQLYITVLCMLICTQNNLVSLSLSLPLSLIFLILEQA